MRIPEDCRRYNVAHQSKLSGSILNFWKDMLVLRKQREDELVCRLLEYPSVTLTRQVYGSFELLSAADEHVFAYYRADRTILVVLNFSEETVEYAPPVDLSEATVIIETESGSIKANDSSIQLQPFTGALWGLRT